MFTLLNMAMCFVAPTGAKIYFGIHSGTKMNQVRAIKFLGNYFKNRLPHKNGYMAQNPSHASKTLFLHCYIQQLAERHKLWGYDLKDASNCAPRLLEDSEDDINAETKEKWYCMGEAVEGESPKATWVCGFYWLWTKPGFGYKQVNPHFIASESLS